MSQKILGWLKKSLSYKRVYLILLFPLGLVITMLAPKFPHVVESVYSLTLYPILSVTVNFITSLFPFSLAEIFLIIFFPAVLFYIIFSVVMLVLHRNQWKKRLFCLVSSLTAAACTIYFLFVVCCGLNYHRSTFSEYSGLTLSPSSKTELYNLCLLLTQRANAFREQTQQDQNGVLKLSDDNRYETAKAAKECYNDLAKDYPVLKGAYGQPKPVLFSRAMSRTEITGVFFPFTFEANVNIDIPEYSIPVTMCHELTHLRGFMREDEANFLAYLACIRSDRADFNYSGTMLALSYSMGALASADEDLWSDIRGQYSDQLNADLAHNNAYWKQFEDTVISKVSNNVNNSYLKANKQEDGVKSYGRMVDLLLAYYRKDIQ